MGCWKIRNPPHWTTYLTFIFRCSKPGAESCCKAWIPTIWYWRSSDSITWIRGSIKWECRSFRSIGIATSLKSMGLKFENLTGLYVTCTKNKNRKTCPWMLNSLKMNFVHYIGSIKQVFVNFLKSRFHLMKSQIFCQKNVFHNSPNWLRVFSWHGEEPPFKSVHIALMLESVV